MLSKLLPCLNDKRITVLLGAGTPMELYTNGIRPSTENITRSMVENLPLKQNGQGEEISVSLIEDIYNRLCGYHRPPLPPAAQGSAGKIHFEILFHIVEELTSYYWSAQPNTTQRYVVPFAPFVNLIPNINVEDLYVTSRHIINKIAEVVNDYDEPFDRESNNWYKQFWQSKKNDWDVFNLNYDTTIEQSLGSYEDGFMITEEQENFMRFDVNRLLRNRNRFSTINHIHGCIVYGPSRYQDINYDVYDYETHDMYKWPDYRTASVKWNGQVRPAERAQNGQEIIQGPIITGLSKSDKVTCLPYDIYRYNFNRCILKNRSLLIVGYSFGDKYINHMFYRLSQIHGDNKRVVLIDYWNMQNAFQSLTGEATALTDNDLSERLLDYYFSSNGGNLETLMFIKRVAHCDMDIWQHFNQLSLSEPMISDNKQLMLMIGGFKNAVENHSKEILNFLDFRNK